MSLYAGPVLRSGIYVYIDGEEHELTIPRHALDDEQWRALLDDGWIEWRATT